MGGIEKAGGLSVAARVSEVAELSGESRKVLQPGMAPRDYVEALAKAGEYEAALRFLAHLLPKREAVWWCWVSARRALPEPTPEVKASLDATEKWIAQPTEEHRRGAMETAEKAGVDTPAGCAGLAAFLSGGSMAPPNVPVVPPGEHLTARAVVGALLLAAAVSEPEKAMEKHEAFLAQGMDVARRIKLWERIGS